MLLQTHGSQKEPDMIRASQSRVKSLDSIIAGELIRLTSGTDVALALCLASVGGTAAIGLFDGTSNSSPMSWANYRGFDNCLSYGVDWYLEEVHGNETGMNLHQENQNHGLYVTTEGAVLAFRSESGRRDRVHFNVHSNQPTGLGGTATPVSRWRIWESIDARNREEAPLFSMGF